MQAAENTITTFQLPGIGSRRWRQLGEMLLQRGYIDQDKLSIALEKQRDEDRYLGEVLLELELVDQTELYSTLADQAGIPFVRLEPKYQDPAIAGVIQFSMIRTLRAIPLFKVDKRLTVAMDDPTNLDRLQEIAFATGCRVNAVYTTPEIIDAAISARTGNLIDVKGLHVAEELSETDRAGESLSNMSVDWTADAADLSKSSVVIDLIDNLIIEALTIKASDIHLEPKGRHLRVRFRIDGILQDRPSIPNGYKMAVLSRCKIMADMDIAERRVPQDGAFSMNFHGRRVDFRVSTFPTKYGEVVVVRILDRSALKLELATLGFPPDLATKMTDTVNQPNGILLVTGPTGSGKTSTLYALLQELDAATKKIITLEDPIEYDLADICQGQTHAKAGFTFAKGLRSILRQDPDCIMVGEVRDVETAQIAIQASLTGHMVMSTLHTNSAAAAISRLLDMGLEPFLMATSLSGILAQRLVRRLCGNCKESYTLDAATVDAMGLEFPSGSQTPTLYKAKGCMYCNGLGYRGRLGIFEYVGVDQKVQSMIIRRISGKDLERELTAGGCDFTTLRASGLAKVEAGETTLEEVLRVTTG
ncbi:MAG: type II/IV secretion system protein [Proteobacteria bacterium]|nr:type II/IV secretion system protein [Pseudomonadota bacterium]